MTKEKIRDALAAVLGFKPVKTVRQKLLVIIVHVLLWGLFLILPLYIYRVRIPDVRFFYREIINKAFLIALFYFNFYYLLPRLFKKRQLLSYFLSLMAALIVICAQQMILEVYFLKIHKHRFDRFYLAATRPYMVPRSGNEKENKPGTAELPLHQSGPGGEPMPGEHRSVFVTEQGYGTVAIAEPVEGGPGNKQVQGKSFFIAGNDSAMAVGLTESGMPPPPPFPFFKERFPRMMYIITLKDALSAGIVILLLSGFIKLAHSLFVSEKQKKILETERLNAELNFLKLQINPHFLFNTLNSIYSQAHFKSEQTEHSILKFSRIMRYVLYDSTADKIQLANDLEYISNYIDLQKLRLSKNITIQYNVSGRTNGLVIAPLLLITFIENAFKHGISYTAPSEINISIAVIENELTLTVGNAITQSSRESSGGVGLINARRRLDVIYPGRHLLDVVENDHLYIVNLKIELDYES